MKRLKNQILPGIGCLLLSFFLYNMDYEMYGNSQAILKSLIEQLAFIPIYVLIVMIVIEEVLNKREKKAMMNRLNMIVGVFYSEIGTKLLKLFFKFDKSYEEFSRELIITNKWTSAEFSNKGEFIKKFNFELNSRNEDLNLLKDFILPNNECISKMIINTNLSEHETFTELLLALAHLSEELGMRKNVKDLSKVDFEHISVDMKRVYVLLILEWLAYMKHIKEEYPYLYALAIRMNPFDPKARVEME